MSGFVFLGVQDADAAQKVCVCCLWAGRPSAMVGLDSCPHTGFLIGCLQLKMAPADRLVCCECHSMLRRIHRFRLQVEESSRLLSSQLQDTPLEGTKRSSNLKTTPIEIVDSTVPVEEPAEDKIDELDVKTEDDRFSGSESDLPLIQVKVERSEAKNADSNPKKSLRKKSVKKEARKQPPDKYKGLFRLVHLSETDIAAERAKMAAEEGYQRLPYKCASCIVGFDYQTNLDEHNLKKHSAKEGFKCGVCLSVLGTEPSYRDHVRRHAKRYECVQCSRRVVTVESARSHCRQRHGIEPRPARLLRCRHCPFTTERLRVYRYHLDKHKEKPQCTECGRSFINASILKNHMLTLHARGSRVFACLPCGKHYASRSGLSAHQHDRHGARAHERAFCDKCGSWFKSRRNLDTHLRTSRKHRPAADDRFVCLSCPRSFHIRSLLDEHTRFVHLKDDRHKCVLCGNKSFINKAQLRKHVKVVHEKDARPRDKICDYCGRGFTSNSILRTHIRTHTGERPLRCEHCSARFAHPGALYTHTRLLHKTPGGGPQT